MKIEKRISIQIMMFSFCLITILAPGKVFAQNYELKSPDGGLTITFETVLNNQTTNEEGTLVYSVSYQGKPLIERSALRLDFHDQQPLGEDIKIINSEKGVVDQSYELFSGRTSYVQDHYNALKIDLQEDREPARKLSIEARAYDDAVAFRYIVPEQSGMNEYRLKSERTAFKISKDAITYAQVLPDFKHSYESEYIKLPISSFSHQGSAVNDVLIGLPLLMEVPGVAWMAINEADLQGYSSMYLTTLTRAWAGHWLGGILAPRSDDTTVCVKGTLPLVSAWRILQVSTEPGTLIESNILTNLNRENVIKETSWIKPGKSAWNWWSGSIGPDGQRAGGTEGMKYYVDFAAKSGLEYLLIDAGWTDRGDITNFGRVNIPEVVEYANQKNVGIWIWLHYNDAVRQMDEAFPIYEKWGVAGLKIDFIKQDEQIRDDQDGIEFYYRTAEKAAQHHLMLDFHGSTKPTGLSRTYPNILGYEGVVGMEVSKGSLRDNPDCHLMLPFTRMLQGYMDYTPGGFDNVTKEDFVPRRSDPMVMGTRAHHLAMYVVYDSPIQMVSDHPTAYEGQPSFQFIKDVPASWDETQVLNGIPGEYITIARRKADEWFLGSMTNWNPRQFEISLDFLGEGNYIAEIYRDGQDSDRYPRHILIENKSVSKGQHLKIRLSSAGGCTIRFKPE